MKRKIASLLALITLLASANLIFTSCSDKTEGMTEPESTALEESIQEEAKLEKIYLVKSDKASAQINKLVEGASELIAKQTDIPTEIVSDADFAYQAKENHYYVLFGDTAYEQSKALSSAAEEQKIYYAAKEDSVAIYANTDQLMSIGAEKLFADCVKDGSFDVSEEYAALTVDASAYVKENWTLNCPAFTRGMLDDQTYNLGYGMERNKDYSYMHIARSATAQLYTDYLKQLESLGYKKEFENEIDGNLYASYIGALGSNIYVYFTKAKYEVRIIEDNVSAPLSEFNYKLDASKDTRLYAFKQAFKSEDCFLIHLADNSWIIIDGGRTGRTAGSSYVRDLYNFMAEKSSLAAGEKLPIDPMNATIYYVGPTPAKPGTVIGSAGPTTSGRMDAYAPTMMSVGARGMIGKGARLPEVVDAMKKFGGVYFGAIGGAGALLAKCIKSAKLIAYEDLGAEALRELYVEDMPLMVIIDSEGNNLYELGREEYLASKK